MISKLIKEKKKKHHKHAQLTQLNFQQSTPQPPLIRGRTRFTLMQPHPSSPSSMLRQAN